MAHPIILLQAAAPAKPAAGQTCNGCGVCCAWKPCPFRKRHGACAALRWHDDSATYRCAMVSAPQTVWTSLPRWLQPMVRRLARRWIASGVGCDSDLEAERG